MKEFTKYYVRLFMFLMPILFLPMTTDSFGVGKNILIAVMALLGSILWVVEIIAGKKEVVKTNKAWVLMLVVTVWAWIGWLRMTDGVKLRSVLDVTGVGVLTAMVVWFFLWLQVGTVEERKHQLNWLTASGLLVAVVSVIVFLVPTASMPINWPKNSPIVSIGQTWSLTGFVISEIILFLFLVMEWGKKLFSKLKGSTEEDGSYLVEAMITSFLTLALALDLFKIFKNGWFNLDGASAWGIAVETFKRNPIWGVGAGNFIAAFNSFRPESYNLTANWANGFLHSNSGILNYWTELGLVGMVVGLIAIASFLKLKKDYDFATLMVLLLINLFLPVNLLGMMLLVWVVSKVMVANRTSLVLKMGEGGFNVAPIVLGLILLAGSVGGGYWLYRIGMADIYIYKSVMAASKNNGGETYNLQIKGIGLNPYLSEYRRMYSQTNIALAGTLLVSKDITDDEKQKASTLVQQSVREAKAAIALDPQNPIYWTNLAIIYRQLVGVVDGAADWSFQAYQQATVFDPVNPTTQLELGGLLFASNRFDDADRIFEKVVTLKSDFANGWYNWAYSAKKLNKLDYAVSRLTQAVALVPTTSGDYEKASKELIAWKKELDDLNAKQKAASAQGSGEPKQPETLKAPEVLPTTNPKEQVVVPTGELNPPTN